MQKVKIKDCIQLENSRGKFNKQEMADLMSSLKQDGLLQSIGVRPKGKKFEIVYGNRRFLAAKKLGWSEIDAKVLKNTNDKEFLLINLVENIQREDITVFEQGRLFSLLRDKYKLSVPEIAVRVGLNKTKVTSAISIFNDTPPEFRNKIKWSTGGKNINRKGTVPVSVAEKINQLCRNKELNHTKAKPIYQEVINDNLGMRDIDVVVEQIAQGKSVKSAIKNAKKVAEEVQYLRLTIPLYKNEVKEWHDNWQGVSLSDDLKSVIYSNSDFSEPC